MVFQAMFLNQITMSTQCYVYKYFPVYVLKCNTCFMIILVQQQCYYPLTLAEDIIFSFSYSDLSFTAFKILFLSAKG